jgi:alpha-ketoglutarate-dependent taurine dioxygenase
MSDFDPEQFSRERLKATTRRAVSATSAALVSTGQLQPEKPLPLVVRPAVKGLELATWAANNRAFIDGALLKHGGILFRDFNVKSAGQFSQFMRAVTDELLEYNERSSPRTEVSDNVYTSTDYPAAHSIFVHNENSYQRVWPMRIFFYCATPADAGGETPIADCRRVFARLTPRLRERFAEKRWMYVRNFGDGLGLPWETVFQTTERAVVEEHCGRSGIEAKWKDGGRLRLRAVRPAVRKHPRTGEPVWFNHATFFHITTLEREAQEVLLAEYAEDDLPTNTFYGDGSPIEPEVLEELREAYRQETIVFPWQAGDILLLDNMLAAHGRSPYAGARKILVGMADPSGDAEEQTGEELTS